MSNDLIRLRMERKVGDSFELVSQWEIPMKPKGINDQLLTIMRGASEHIRLALVHFIIHKHTAKDAAGIIHKWFEIIEEESFEKGREEEMIYLEQQEHYE